ncbi:MAG TPA: HAMP domain-containing sensor histidine kinase [Alphaproteobacteria bacterium]|nr:HAMP domain-containing sensor histidine kinase [Alphaproteobacteria bacterium]
MAGADSSTTDKYAQIGGLDGTQLLGPEELAWRIAAEQVRLLHRNAPPALIANVAMAVGAALALWSEVPHARTGLWIWLVIALSAARTATWLIFPGKGVAGPREVRRWCNLITVGAALSGCAWGAIALLLMPPDALLPELFLGAAIAAIAAATLSSLAHRVGPFLAFLLPSILPYGAAMAVSGDDLHLMIALAAVGYGGGLIAIACNFARSSAATIKLQVENEWLVGGLLAARDEALSAARNAEAANLVKTELCDTLDRSRREAEDASRAKSHFLAAMSHELRTPLNAIIGFSDIMATQVLGPVGNAKYLEYACDIRVSGQHLLAIINNVLDLSKVEAGRFELHEEEVQLLAVVAAAQKLVKQQANDSGLALEAQVASDLTLLADERALKQIVINLLSNAVKFSRENGSVSVNAFLDEGSGLVLSVRDDGIGISQKDVDRLLEPFRQADEPLIRKHTGTGLGLALVKSLVELHGGSIRLDSVFGTGTTVSVRFPPSRVRRRAA